MTKTITKAALAATVSAWAILAGSAALAADPNTQSAGAGAEGTDVNTIIVTAERGIGAKTAPVKASLDETQPESIISHNFIEQITPETGNISTVIFIAPSISGISGNAGGIGNYFSTTMRGFPDGEYNVTYDGIAFGDTNNPTHHPNDYFPTSTIGAAVVDRGPGAAGDLGQANYGGAIHYFSPDVSDHFGIVQKLTYGSFDTIGSTTTLNTGDTAGGKLLLNFDERHSNTELTDSGGNAYNQMAKYVLPINSQLTFTALLSHAWSRYNFPDGDGPGETLQQLEAYGKNYQLNNNPTNADYVGYNYERKQTLFNYVDLKYQANEKLSVEDELYHYFYSNKTDSATNTDGLLTGPNVSPTKPAAGNDIGGYYKRNDYTVIGDIVRANYETPWGVLKVGGLVEGSDTYRQKAYYDFTTGAPDIEFTPAKDPGLPAPSNCKTCEHSNWLQEQVFVDYYWKPIDGLTITPGFKFVNFRREIDAAEDTLSLDSVSKSGTITSANTVAPIKGENTYSSPLYFLTANYKILPEWAVYAQFATSFLIPQLSELQVPGVSLQNLKPETTTNYQLGTVYTKGALTADADLYLIDAANTNVACNIVDPQGGYDAASCNAGKVTYSGFEGEAAYALPFGLTAFVNGSINDARQAAQGVTATDGLTPNPAQELANVPNSTAAFGGIYHRGPWQLSLTYKMVGSQVTYGAAPPGGFPVQIKLPSYDTWNASIDYAVSSNYEIKLQGFNLADKRTLIGYTPSGSETGLYQTNGGEYEFQSGREIDVTLVGKF